nr:DNA internalization-related competence protein ComEC/Rec2 [Deinobacterium chartae]
MVWGLLLPLVACLTDRRAAPALLVLLAVAGGWLRAALEPQGDPLQVYREQPVTLSGTWDGQFLSLEEPPARVALSPRPALPPGQLTVSGRLGAPQGRGNFGGFDYAAWLSLRGVKDVLYGAKVKEHLEAGGLRAWFARGLHAGLPEREGALMLALELGDRRETAEQTLGEWNVNDAFARAGTAHFMALSGQHVAILVGAAGLLLVPLGAWRYPVLILLLIGYLLLVGTAPSILRAGLQGGAVLFALWVGRGRLEVVGTLALAGLVSLLAEPDWLLDLGFQLSYLAVLGLALSARLAERLPPWGPAWLRLGLCATFCAQLTTLPLIADAFGALPWISLLSNAVCAPLMVPLVPLGLLAGLLGPAGAAVNLLTGPLASLLLTLTGFFARPDPLPWSSLEPSGYLIYGLWASGVALWLLRRLRGVHLLLLTLLAILAAALPSRLLPARELVFLDVGQGDSTLLRLGERAVLIDGGGTPRGDYDVGERTVIPALRALGVLDLEVVVATHADADHIEGLVSVLRRVPVRELWIGHRKPGDPLLEALLTAARERGVRVREVRRGDVLELPGARLEVLAPWEPFRAQDNANSVALRLEAGPFRAAFLGDTPTPLEEALGLGELDLLKVAHHGSRHSTSEKLLQETRPRMAVISVGRNGYGHPAPDVIARLEAAGTQVWRTDRVGAVRLRLP